MIRIEDKVNCVGCANCVQICPQQCIYFVRDEEGFFYPKVDEAQCLHCNKISPGCVSRQTRNRYPWGLS